MKTKKVKIMSKFIKTSIIVLLGFLLSLLCVYLRVPFAGVFLLWFLIFLWIGFSADKSYLKIPAFIITAIFLFISISEIYYWKAKKTEIQYSKTSTVSSSLTPSFKIIGNKYENVPHQIYGYSPLKNSKRKVAAYMGDQMIYDITYTIDENGLRISPEPKKKDAPAIIFFGDSFTYGESVSDDETMPYVTGILTNREYAIYNFGISGHGPQLMLAQIEHGIVDSVVKKHKPQLVIYQFIDDNIIRLKGMRSWLRNGPQYVMNINGEIVSSPTKKFLLKMHAKLKQSYLYDALYGRISDVKIHTYTQFLTHLIKEDDYGWGTGEDKIDMKLIKTFAGVVDKSRNLLESKYPGIQFHVIYWNESASYKNDNLGNIIITELRKKEITVHRMTDILPGSFKYDNKNPFLVPYDGHPTPLAHKIIANYVVKEILTK